MNRRRRIVGIGYNAMPVRLEGQFDEKMSKSACEDSTKEEWINTKYPYGKLANSVMVLDAPLAVASS